MRSSASSAQRPHTSLSNIRLHRMVAFFQDAGLVHTLMQHDLLDRVRLLRSPVPHRREAAGSLAREDRVVGGTVRTSSTRTDAGRRALDEARPSYARATAPTPA